MSRLHAPPPGARVRIRGEEWAVERSLPLTFGDGFAVHVQGLTELVRHHKAIFLTSLDEVTELKPEATQLVTDSSAGYRQTVLYLETLLRRMPPVHSSIAVAHRGALDVMAYQLVPTQRALEGLKPRILLADGTGLGKTVEIGILLSELIKRGRGRRILVVAIKSMLAQLQRELWARFTLPLVRLDSEGLARVQSKIPSNKNPFSYFDRCIVSMDTLKNQGLYRAYLEQIRWDVIVVDECHNVANRGSQRGELARLLSSQCDALVLTSATPHNGRPESFANLMRMLDPTSVANPKRFEKKDVEHLFVRRFKKDVEREAGDHLRDRDVATITVPASEDEEAALAALHALSPTTLRGKSVRKDPLVKWTLVKALLSSHEACWESLEHRIRVTEEALAPKDKSTVLVERRTGLTRDLAALTATRRHLERAMHAGAPKLAALLAELKKLAVSAKKGSNRVVIFSERIATLRMLKEAIATGLKLPEEAIGVFTASQGGAGLGASAGDEKAQRALVESFGHADSPLRVLLCSDAASEGVNLHHQCHHLFHYDVPWSLIRLTQRNGRIDRFGQKKTPHPRYLLTASKQATADQHVTRRLIDKEREVERQLGDPGALLGLYDPELEEVYLLRGIAADKPVDALLPDEVKEAGAATTELEALGAALGEEPAQRPATEPDEAPEIDLFSLFAAVEKEQAISPSLVTMTAETPSLFPSDYELVVSALHHLEKSPLIGAEPLRWSANEQEKSVEVHVPEPFRRFREPFLPDEATPRARDPYRLVMGRDVVSAKLQTSLDEEGRWPDWHLLWEQHPFVEWLFDALASAYARGEAPLVRAPLLGKGAALYWMQGIYYNHESEAVFAKFFGVEADLSGDKPILGKASLSMQEMLERTGIGKGLANADKPFPQRESLQKLVPIVVQTAMDRFAAERTEEVRATLSRKVRKETRRVEAWAEESLALVAQQEQVWGKDGRRIPQHIALRFQRERDHIAQVKQNHEQLLKSLTAAGEPYIRLVAVFTGDK